MARPVIALRFVVGSHVPCAIDFRYNVSMSTPDERDTDGVTSPLHLAAQFNALPEQEKKQVFSEGLGFNLLHSGLEFIIPLW